MRFRRSHGDSVDFQGILAKSLRKFLGTFHEILRGDWRILKIFKNVSRGFMESQKVPKGFRCAPGDSREFLGHFGAF